MESNSKRLLEAVHLSECTAHILRDVALLLAQPSGERVRESASDMAARGHCIHHVIAAEILLMAAYEFMGVTADDIFKDYAVTCSEMIAEG